VTSPVPPPLPLEGPPAASSPDEGEDLVTVPSRPTLSERLSGEVLGGVLVLVAAALGITWANSPWSHAYEALSDWTVGPASWHLDLTLHAWASDGLLAVFFLVVGLELKRELVDGALRHVATAALPALTAVAGMVVPALVFLVTVALHPAATQAGDLRGWAVPTATDIAFALAVLAVVGRSLPGGVRLFLLTLAVVDDLLAIVVIAVVYTDEMHLGALAAAVPLLAAFAVAVRVRPRGLARFHRLSRTVWLLVVVALALAVWFAVHASGVHATIAGVALGLVVPARPRPGSHISLAERAEHAVRPWSAALARSSARRWPGASPWASSSASRWACSGRWGC
jgi:NhaA family Na+:H+ antiporter